MSRQVVNIAKSYGLNGLFYRPSQVQAEFHTNRQPIRVLRTGAYRSGASYAGFMEAAMMAVEGDIVLLSSPHPTEHVLQMLLAFSCICRPKVTSMEDDGLAIGSGRIIIVDPSNLSNVAGLTPSGVWVDGPDEGCRRFAWVINRWPGVPVWLTTSGELPLAVITP